MAAVDNSGAQTGDQSYGSVAGGNISTNDPGPWLTFMREYLHDLDSQRQRRDEELSAELRLAHMEIDRLGDEVRLYQAAIGARMAAERDAAHLSRLIAAAALALAALALALSILL